MQSDKQSCNKFSFCDSFHVEFYDRLLYSINCMIILDPKDCAILCLLMFLFCSNWSFEIALFLAVRPDPPVSLNWTLLNISPSGLSYDVRVNWESPPSADVRVGWMRIEYEIQYRERNATNWEAVSDKFLLICSYVHTVDTCEHTPEIFTKCLCTQPLVHTNANAHS